MDGSQFDVWTRRSFGLAAGGLSASLLAAAGVEGKKKGKKKKKKKKCINLGQECDPDGKACCDCLACGPAINGVVENVCCRPGGTPCTVANENECCSSNCVGDFCTGKSNGQTCIDDGDCFSFNCVANTCQP